MNGRLDKLAPGLYAKLNFICDELLLVFTLFLTGLGWGASTPMLLFALMGAAASAWFVAAGLLRLYSPCTPRTKFDAVILSLLATVGVAVGVALLQGWLWPLGETSVDVTSFAMLFGLCTVTARLVFMTLLSRIEQPLNEVLIVGTGPEGVATYHRLTTGAGERCRVKGFIRMPGQPDTVAGVAAPVLGDIDAFDRVMTQRPVNEVYIAAQVIENGLDMQRVVRSCEELGLPFALPINFLRLTRASLLTDGPEHDGYLHYLSTRYSPAPYAFKRIIDLVASFAALVVLSPLLIGVAVAIKLTSKGPILFKQERVGLHGYTFNLFKFRSMVTNAEELRVALMAKNEQTGPVFKMKNDPRITRVGRFIRKYSIDELPQLINILRGDMTIVGPRPALPNEVAQYKLWQRRRLSVRPGLTCYWQVGGRNNIGFEEWMKLDLMYVDNWNLAVDARLILQTLPVVLAGRGAS